MFEKNKKEKVTIVTTKEQLKEAVRRRDACIEVHGELAKKMNWMTKLTKKKLALIAAALIGVTVTAPATAGTSLVATGTAMSTEAASLTVLLGAAVVGAILNSYDVEVVVGNVILKLTKNK